MAEDDPTLGDYLEEFLRRPRHPHTQAMYASIALCHLRPLLGEMRLRELKRRRINTLLDELAQPPRNLMPNTIRTVRSLLSAVCRSAVEDEVLEANPVLGTRHIKVTRTPRCFTAEDQATFFDRLPVEHRFTSLYCALPTTGVRIHEGLGIQWADFNLGRAELVIERQWSARCRRFLQTKGKNRRVIDLAPAVIAVFGQMTRTGPFVWGSPAKSYLHPYNYSTVRWDFQRRLLVAGLVGRGYTLHSFRHAYATRLREQGADLGYLKEQLGHTSIGITTDLYTRSARTPRPGLLTRLGPRGFDRPEHRQAATEREGGE